MAPQYPYNVISQKYPLNMVLLINNIKNEIIIQISPTILALLSLLKPYPHKNFYNAVLVNFGVTANTDK